MLKHLDRIQLLCNSLHNFDHPVSETMQINTILAVLTVEYKHIIAVITASIQPYDLVGVS